MLDLFLPYTTLSYIAPEADGPRMSTDPRLPQPSCTFSPRVTDVDHYHHSRFDAQHSAILARLHRPISEDHINLRRNRGASGSIPPPSSRVPRKRQSMAPMGMVDDVRCEVIMFSDIDIICLCQCDQVYVYLTAACRDG